MPVGLNVKASLRESLGPDATLRAAQVGWGEELNLSDLAERLAF